MLAGFSSLLAPSTPVRKLIPILLCINAWSQTGSVEGIVIDMETDQALVGVNITINDSIGTVSGASGNFQLSGLTPGRILLSASHIGYQSQLVDDFVLTASEHKYVELKLSRRNIEFDPLIVSASRKMEKMLDTPSRVTLIQERDIATKTVVLPVSHLIAQPGIDIATTGIGQVNVVARGFNDYLSGDLLFIVDNRVTSVPSIRMNLYDTPIINEDIEKIEIVLGPVAALYGSNSANGAVHIITKKPRNSQGTDISLSIGERQFINTTFRNAKVVNDAFEYRISGQVLQATDWEYVDPVEHQNRRLAVAQAIVDGVDTSSILIGKRLDQMGSYKTDLRLDFRPGKKIHLILNGGFLSGTTTAVTKTSAMQWVDSNYGYIQGRALYQNWFAQFFYNMIGIGGPAENYILRDGSPSRDNSKSLGTQIQHHSIFMDRFNLTYGMDMMLSRPDTKGTISGRNEDNDDVNETGAYVHLESNINEDVKYVVSSRLDYHNRVEKVMVSPRVALVYQPAEIHNFRLTLNKAYKTPRPYDLFIDRPIMPLSADYSLNFYGVLDGFHFKRDQNGGIDGLYIQSPFYEDPSVFLPADVSSLWPLAVERLQQNGTDISTLPVPGTDAVGTELKLLSFTEGYVPISATSVKDIKRLTPTQSTTLEAGYKGLIHPKVSVSADLYHSWINDYIGTSGVVTPQAYLNQSNVADYLVSNGYGQEESDSLAGVISSIPLGTVTPENTLDPADLFITTFNYGSLTVFGLDLSVSYIVNNRWRINGNYSFVNKDLFEDIDGTKDIALNAPRNKAGAHISYSNETAELHGQLRLRYIDAFPVLSGIYDGTIPSYVVLDLNLDYKLPISRQVRMALTVQNLLDNKHQEILGAPEIGRLAMIRLAYHF